MRLTCNRAAGVTQNASPIPPIPTTTVPRSRSQVLTGVPCLLARSARLTASISRALLARTLSASDLSMLGPISRYVYKSNSMPADKTNWLSEQMHSRNCKQRFQQLPQHLVRGRYLRLLHHRHASLGLFRYRLGLHLRYGRWLSMQTHCSLLCGR